MRCCRWPTRRLLDRQLAGEDLRQHVAQDVAVLDVDPVLRRRDEPAPGRSPLVDARSRAGWSRSGCCPSPAGAFSSVVLVKSLIQSAASALLALVTGTARSEPPRKPGIAWPFDVARHHELRRSSPCTVLPTQQLNQLGPDHRARPGPVRTRRTGSGASRRSSCSPARRPWKKFLYAVRPAIDFGESSSALPLAADLRRDPAAVVEDEAHREVPVGAGDVDRREALLRVLRQRASSHRPTYCGGRRRQLRDAGLLEEVGAVGDDARAGVVRDAVRLPPYAPEAARPLSQVAELSNVDLSTTGRRTRRPPCTSSSRCCPSRSRQGRRRPRGSRRTSAGGRPSSGTGR